MKVISVEVIDTAKADKAIQAGDINRIIALVDAKVMPNVNFEVMTRAAVGPQWRTATPEQRTKLQAEFKTLLVRVYSGGLVQKYYETPKEVVVTASVFNSNISAEAKVAASKQASKDTEADLKKVDVSQDKMIQEQATKPK